MWCGEVDETHAPAAVQVMDGAAVLASIRQTTLFNVAPDRVEYTMAMARAAIKAASTVEDAKRLTELTDGLAAMVRRLKVADDIKKEAIRLVVAAEKKLGKIMQGMPLRSSPSKGEILAKHGIDKRRASLAQSLAKIPDRKLEKAINDGARSMHGVQHRMGLLSDNYHLREKRLAAYKLLAEEAVGLLEQSVKREKVPHRGTVGEMSQRLRNIQAQGFAKV